MFSIIVTIDTGDGRSLSLAFTVERSIVSVGRASMNDLVLPEPNVSRLHARIALGDERIVVSDLDSRYGTHLEGRWVTEPTEVLPTDELRIGRYRLQVVAGRPAPERFANRTLVAGGGQESLDWCADGATIADALPHGAVEAPFWCLSEGLLPSPEPGADDGSGSAPGPAGRSPSWFLAAEELQLLAMVEQAPEDDAPRAVYADWLIERERPVGAIITSMLRPVPEPDDNAALRRYHDGIGEQLYRYGRAWMAPLGVRYQVTSRAGVAGEAYVSNWNLAGSSGAPDRRSAGDEAARWSLSFRVERGFLAYPVCVPRDLAPSRRDPLFRLSPVLYRVEDEVWSWGELHLHRALVLAPGQGNGHVAIKRAYTMTALQEKPHGDDVEARALRNAVFRREAGILSLIDHPNVARSPGLAYWGSAGDLALALEWRDGYDLRDLLRVSRDRWRPWVAVAVARQICQGLRALENALGSDGLPAGIAYYGLWTGAIWIDRLGQVILRDVHGAAIRRDALPRAPEWAQPEQTLISHENSGCPPAYRAPEVIRDSEPTAQSAVFAAGVVLYEMVCGRHPFAGAERSGSEVLQAIRLGLVPLPRQLVPIRSDLEAVILGAMATEPSQRYASASDMLRGLEEIIARRGWPSDNEAVAAELEPLHQRLDAQRLG